jgi:tetratricopeptide (TPR) repeat protein
VTKDRLKQGTGHRVFSSPALQRIARNPHDARFPRIWTRHLSTQVHALSHHGRTSLCQILAANASELNPWRWPVPAQLHSSGAPYSSMPEQPEGEDKRPTVSGGDGELCFKLGAIFQRRGLHDKAVKCYERAIAQGAGYKAHFNLAMALLAFKDFEGVQNTLRRQQVCVGLMLMLKPGAEEHFRTTIARSEGGVPDAFVNLSGLLLRREQVEEALEVRLWFQRL